MTPFTLLCLGGCLFSEFFHVHVYCTIMLSSCQIKQVLSFLPVVSA